MQEGQKVRRSADVRVETWDQRVRDPLGERGPLLPRLLGARHLRVEEAGLFRGHLSDVLHNPLESVRQGYSSGVTFT